MTPAVLEARKAAPTRLVGMALVGMARLDRAEPGPELSVVVPALNERENASELVRALKIALAGRSWEVIFVDDDSPDGTADVVRELARLDRRVRCLQRIGRRGLSSACIEGALASSARYIAVMDGDLQHDERLLPRMLDILNGEGLDVVVGSRHAPGGSVGNWHKHRVRISDLATRISRSLLHAPLSDPLSGFFIIRRDAFVERVRSLSGIGFKILLDLFASGSRPLRFREVPYEFRGRHRGDSKLDSRAAWDFVMLVLDKRLGGAVPVRFVMFALIGAIGVAVHLAAMGLLFKGVRLSFDIAQAGATLTAMTGNFALNNALTYRDLRLRSWRWLRGWTSFVLACSVGALANIGVAAHLFRAGRPWLVAALAGTVVGVVWNYLLTSNCTWRASRAG